MLHPVIIRRCATQNTTRDASKEIPQKSWAKSFDEWTRKEKFDPDDLERIVDRFRLETTKPVKGIPYWYGVPEDAVDKFVVKSVGGHTFKVCPVHVPKSDVSRSQLYRYYAGQKIPQTIGKIENTRALVHGMSNKDKVQFITCVMNVRNQFLGQAFHDPKWGIDYESFERMLYPKYLPSYREAVAAFRLPSPWRYRPHDFMMLENISRFPLDKVDQGSVHLTFEEWHSLLLNYYEPIHPLQFYLQCMNASILYTREFIDEFADYLRQRCLRHNWTQPILDIISPSGRLAYLLNRTGRLPVPVIPCHERPHRGMYFMKIPRHVQADFHLPSPRALDVSQALEEYRPNIVICQDMPRLKDLTRRFRGEGSVCEYILLGIPLAYVQGDPWLTWGNMGNKPADDNSRIPHHEASGFRMTKLDHISRWIIEKQDSHITMGFCQVVSFVKDMFKYTPWERIKHRLRRLQN